MSFYDSFTPTYTFRLQIERSDRMILDTEITAKGTPDEIAKAKKNVQRLLTDYTPTVKTPEPVPTPAPEADAPALPEPEAQTPTAEPQEAAAPPSPPESRPGDHQKTGWGEGASPPLLPGVRERLRDFPAGVPDRGGV